MSVRPLRIALAQGTMSDDGYAALKAVGLPTAELDARERRLVVPAGDVVYMLGRPSDIPTYVAHGAADLGITGKDVLMEQQLDVLELVDLGYGLCRFIVAGPADRLDRSLDQYRHLGALTVATKYPNVTAEHFQRRGIQVEIIKLGGSVEVAPQVGLADWIVDLVATGRTLKENRLSVVEEIAVSTARLIANRVSYARERERIGDLASRLEKWAAASFPSQSTK